MGHSSGELGIWKEVKPNHYKLNDDQYLVRKKDGTYRIRYPIQKDVTKPFSKDNVHKKNLLLGGSWGNFFQTIFVLAIIGFSILAYYHDTRICKDIIENPPVCNSDRFKANLSGGYYEVDAPIFTSNNGGVFKGNATSTQ